MLILVKPHSRLLLTVLLAMYALSLVNVFVPVVRFSYQPANYGAFALAQILPASFIVVGRRSAGWRRRILIATGAVLLLPASASGIGALGCTALSIGGDASFERLRGASTPTGAVSFYRTNGGATTAFGIVVRQECRVVPGILLVRQLAYEYPADEIRIHEDTPGAIRVTFEDHSETPMRRVDRSLKMRHFCWGGTA